MESGCLQKYFFFLYFPNDIKKETNGDLIFEPGHCFFLPAENKAENTSVFQDNGKSGK